MLLNFKGVYVRQFVLSVFQSSLRRVCDSFEKQEPQSLVAFLSAHYYLSQYRQHLRVRTSEFSHDQNLDLIQRDLIQPSDTLVSLEEKENLNQAPPSGTCSDRSEGAADQILTPCLQLYFKLIKSKHLGMELSDRSFLVLITYHRKKKVQSGLSVLTQIFTLAKTSMN